MQVDIFYETGFDIINIPCNPELLYDRTLFPYHRTFNDVNIVQSDWLGSIVLEDNDLDWNRTADYCIITDEDRKTRTCYVIDHYEMLSENTVKFYLILDPYNTAGGMEPVEQKTGHGEHQPMVVITGSVNRISVPLQRAVNHEDFRQNEHDTFFTLDEPFSPTQRLHMHYDAVPYIPYQPSPTPTPTYDINDFRYPTNNYIESGTGFRRPGTGQYAGQYCLLGESGVFTDRQEIDGGYYINIGGGSGGNNIFHVCSTKSEFVEAVQNNINAALLRLKYQIDALPEANRKFSVDLNNVIIPAIWALIDSYKDVAGTAGAEWGFVITPLWVNNNVSNYIEQDVSTGNITLSASTYGNPFSQTTGYWYRLGLDIPYSTNGTREYWRICEDGTIVKES